MPPVKPKPVDSKEKKKSHKSKKGDKAQDKDVKLEKKCDRSVSLAPTKSTTSKQGRTVSPQADVSSGLEPVKQSGPQMDIQQAASVSQKDTSGSTHPAPSFAHSSFYDQSYGCACAYPPESGGRSF